MPRPAQLGIPNSSSGLCGGVGVLRRFVGELNSPTPCPHMSHFVSPICHKLILFFRFCSSTDARAPAGHRWAAVGGSLLWDAREHEIAALRFALTAQPRAGQQLTTSFDQSGTLTGAYKASLNKALSVRCLFLLPPAPFSPYATHPFP